MLKMFSDFKYQDFSPEKANFYMKIYPSRNIFLLGGYASCLQLHFGIRNSQTAEPVFY